LKRAEEEPGNMKKSAYFLAIIVAFLVIFLDQISKYFFITKFTIDESVPVIKNIFHLTLTKNTGGAFSFFSGNNAMFFWLSVVVIGFLIYSFSQFPKNNLVLISLGFILGGAIGNILDRMFYGGVVDFLDFRIWPVFNLADTFISLGVVGILIYSFKEELFKKKKKKYK